jgi:hypothetical protein
MTLFVDVIPGRVLNTRSGNRDCAPGEYSFGGGGFRFGGVLGEGLVLLHFA